MKNATLVYALIASLAIALAVVRTFLERKGLLRRFFAVLGTLEIALVALLLGSLVVFGCLQIFLRNFFQRGIIWADPLMRHAVLWLGCLGGMMATARIRHISIDVFTRFLPPALQPFRDRLVYLATAAASSVLCLAALRLVLDERAFGEKAFLGVGVWMAQAILPFAFFVVSYRSLVNFLLARKARLIDWEDDVGPAPGREATSSDGA